MVLTIVSNLFEELGAASGYERVAAKFVENEFEKCDRLFEVYYMSVEADHFPDCCKSRCPCRYHARVLAAEMEVMEERVEEPEERTEIRFDAGLAAFQHVRSLRCRTRCKSLECVGRSV